MARPLRIQFAGALYHVMSRGNERQAIVMDDKDRTKRVSWLRKSVEAYKWKLHAFALMSNHDHLFLETPQPNLSAGMRYLNGCYAGYFNRRHDRVGHLFQGRFKAQLVENEGHYFEISRYIHLNPVRAGLVQRPQDWAWSSYHGYHSANQTLPWVVYSRVLREFGGEARSARAHYRRFVHKGMLEGCESPWIDAEQDLIVGSREFVEKVRGICDLDFPSPDLPQLNRLRDGVAVERIVQAVAEELGADPADWLRGCRAKDNARALAAYIARREYGYSPAVIARAIGYTGAHGVSLAVHRIGKAISRHRPAISRIERRLIGSRR